MSLLSVCGGMGLHVYIEQVSFRRVFEGGLLIIRPMWVYNYSIGSVMSLQMIWWSMMSLRMMLYDVIKYVALCLVINEFVMTC